MGLREAGVEARVYPVFLSRLAALVARGGRTRAFVESYALLELLAGRNPSAERKEALNRAMVEARGRIVGLLLERLGERGPVGLFEVAAAANAVDVEMLGYRFEGSLLEVLGEEPVYHRVEPGEVAGALKGARVAWLLDNAGEAVVDILAASILAERLGARVTLYARSLDYETDVTAAEAARLIAELGVGLEVRGSGGRYPPHHPESRTRSELEEYDVVVLKGIANLEAALEAPLEKPLTISLLRAKCRPLARLFGVEKGRPVVTVPSRLPVRLRG